MKIQKALITAAGSSQRALPLQRLVDRDGVEKAALQVIVEEVLAAGVERVGVVVCPGDEKPYATAAGPHAGRLTFVEQANPRGYGDALLRGEAFVAGEPFVHLVSDHLYVSAGDGAHARCAQELVAAAEANDCAVSAVQSTRESALPLYGAIGGHRVAQQQRLYEVETVLEKPTPTQAEQRLTVPGLRGGHYLCFFGMHVLTPAVMTILRNQREAAPQGEMISLSPALAELARRERYLALEIAGLRYNIGVTYGTLNAQLALAMAGKDREEVLAQLVELLATQKAPRPA
ncbi:MAG TPA: sugar phosphate nucleotidyltransferase [Tepidisphaeraceae bacterium]|nr:sugar phosphate nucleotidyltransferase [Tepidisphaeraceae bacterium]